MVLICILGVVLWQHHEFANEEMMRSRFTESEMNAIVGNMPETMAELLNKIAAASTPERSAYIREHPDGKGPTAKRWITQDPEPTYAYYTKNGMVGKESVDIDSIAYLFIISVYADKPLGPLVGLGSTDEWYVFVDKHDRIVAWRHRFLYMADVPPSFEQPKRPANSSK